MTTRPQQIPVAASFLAELEEWQKAMAAHPILVNTIIALMQKAGRKTITLTPQQVERAAQTDITIDQDASGKRRLSLKEKR